MKLFITILIVCVLSTIYSTESVAKRNKKLLDLSGIWKFAIGDDISRAEEGFDDSAWDNIYVPSSWEDEGYPGYDGFAWYRVSFDYTEELKDENLTLVLGFVDDVDEVYINGVFIGSSGSFPPNYHSSYYSERMYHIPQYLLNKHSKNVIAVRVYDARLSGGILRGDVGLYIINDRLLPDVDLSGLWSFNTRDNKDFSLVNYNDSYWGKIYVPLRWDYQGHERYDGFAWYRKEFSLPEKLYDEKLILLLGKIDDYDQTFINGVEIGMTGNFAEIPETFYGDNTWRIERAYYISPSILKTSGKNIIAVRVYDGFNHGGIYEGPIGIITQKRYKEIKKGLNRKKSIWELIFGD